MGIPRILLVDDEEACLVSTKLMLEGAGYDVEAIHSGLDALKLLKKEYKRFSLVLLDLMMPDINGVDFLVEIQKTADASKVPIIIQTGIAEEKEIDLAIKSGAVSYIRKPYSFEIMHKQIKKILKNNSLKLLAD